MLLPVLPHLLILVFILLAACKESITLRQQKKDTSSVNSSTKIGRTNIQITKFNFEMESKKTTTGAM